MKLHKNFAFLFLTCPISLATSDDNKKTKNRRQLQQNQQQLQQKQQTPCGGGTVGTGLCADTLLCCSKYGYCDSTNEHCNPKTCHSGPGCLRRGIPCGGGRVGTGVCDDPYLCCSEYGYCDNTEKHCNFFTCLSGPDCPRNGVPCGNGIVGNGVCEDTSLCCSQYGYCDTTPNHCESSTCYSSPDNSCIREAAVDIPSVPMYTPSPMPTPSPTGGSALPSDQTSTQTPEPTPSPTVSFAPDSTDSTIADITDSPIADENSSPIPNGTASPASDYNAAADDCIAESHETLKKISKDYDDAYSKLMMNSGPYWLDFVKCQDDFVKAAEGIDESCEYDHGTDTIFDIFIDACREAGGSVFLTDKVFKCSHNGDSITVTEKQFPECILPQLISCEGVETIDFSLDPAVYKAYVDNGYDCLDKKLDFYELEEATPTPENGIILPITIGIIAAVVVVIIGITFFVSRNRFQRKLSQMEPNAKSSACDLEQENVQTMPMGAMSANEGFEDTSDPPPCLPIVQAYEVQVVDSDRIENLPQYKDQTQSANLH